MIDPDHLENYLPSRCRKSTLLRVGNIHFAIQPQLKELTFK